jgi:DNA-directed RNA polymerase specialized sigma24 family protein
MDTQDDSYDLFRRAVQQRDADAWASIAARYRYLLVFWAMKCPATQLAGEHCEDIADRAFARAWVALSPERFVAFPNLAALLAYLRTCVAATAIDAARAQAAQERVAQNVERTESLPLEQTMFEHLDRAELWQIVSSVVKTEAERVVLVDRFVLDLPPRTILARHPTLFTDVAAIYAALRNLCDRLRRNQAICRFYEDRRAA